ncbi:MAG: UDP-N-acetylmuramoyl-L-alanyl-D-glutamate--2,6-diaminopimelate ligase, partial [Eubacteriales bacterium]|nr:UDP-N-acetylmuramoyl-L-alanyl-D-glutamate--2,6-diaminopimelate ligase [Eubacteriales bacterium]
TTPESRDLQELLRHMANEGCSHIVMEVSSHSLALNRVAGLTFDVAVFTNLTQDHLDFHGTMDEYAKAKALLFRQCRKAVINVDDEWAETMLASAEGKPVLTCSAEKTGVGLMAKDLRLSASGIRFCALKDNRLERVELGIPCRFTVDNALCVLGCGLQLGIPLSDCCTALRTAQGVKGRVEVVPTGRDFHILIDYAHTPDALENLLLSLRKVTPGRLLVLFGCGGDRDKGKRPIMGEIAERCADLAIVTSDNPRTEDPEAIIADILAGMKGKKSRRLVIADRREAIDRAIRQCRSGDLLVLAGKGHEDYQIVGTEKRHMDERELAAEALARLPEKD